MLPLQGSPSQDLVSAWLYLIESFACRVAECMGKLGWQSAAARHAHAELLCPGAGAMMGFSSLAVMGNSMLLHLETGKLGALPPPLHPQQQPRESLQDAQQPLQGRQPYKKGAAPADSRHPLPV